MQPTPEFPTSQPLDRDSYIDRLSRDTRLELAVTNQLISLGRYIQDSQESVNLKQLNEAIAETKLIQFELCLECSLTLDEAEFMLDLCESRLLIQASSS